jgi:hypothetical protein
MVLRNETVVERQSLQSGDKTIDCWEIRIDDSVTNQNISAASRISLRFIQDFAALHPGFRCASSRLRFV